MMPGCLDDWSDLEGGMQRGETSPLCPRSGPGINPPTPSLPAHSFDLTNSLGHGAWTVFRFDQSSNSKSKWLQFLLCLLTWLSSPDQIMAEDVTAPLRRSGQTTSYHTRDDGALQKGVAWPTPRFADQGDGTILDLLTGLVWMKNAYCWGEQTWANALTKVAGLNAGTENCSGYVTGTHTDWRLPQINELESLMDLGRSGSALPSDHPFSNVLNMYWSATAFPGTGDAWFVSLFNGNVNAFDKGLTFDVWPVRGGR